MTLRDLVLDQIRHKVTDPVPYTLAFSPPTPARQPGNLHAIVIRNRRVYLLSGAFAVG